MEKVVLKELIPLIKKDVLFQAPDLISTLQYDSMTGRAEKARYGLSVLRQAYKLCDSIVVMPKIPGQRQEYKKL